METEKRERERNETYLCLNDPVINPKQEADRDHWLDRVDVFHGKLKHSTLFPLDFYLNFGIPNTQTLISNVHSVLFFALYCHVTLEKRRQKNLRLLIQAENYAVFFNWFKLLSASDMEDWVWRARYQRRWSADIKRKKQKQCEAREELSMKMKKERKRNFHEMRIFWRRKM